MTEREQIIEGLLDVVANLSPFAGDHEDWMKVHRAIKYLKELEPAEAKTMGESKSYGTWWFACGACGHAIDPEDNYCRECGRAVKWDD